MSTQTIDRRRGMTLLEMAITGTVLAMLLVISVQFMRATGNGRRALRRHETALGEAANVMEHLAVKPFKELTAEGVDDVRLCEEALGVLPGATLQVDVAPSEGQPEGKQITVVIRWPEGPDRPDRSVRLTAWRYRQAERE